MALSFPNGAVAADGWNVGRMCGDGCPPAGRLSVFKGFTVSYKPRRGDHAGCAFETDAEYETFVRDRGYVVPYIHPEVALFKARHRADIRRWTRGAVVPAIRNAQSHADVIRIAEEHKARALFAGCDLLAALRFSNGVYAAAHRLRPELFPAGIWP